MHRNSNSCNVATKAAHFTQSVLLCVFNFDAALTSSLFPLLYSFCSFGNVTDIHFPFFVIRHFPAELVLEIFEVKSKAQKKDAGFLRVTFGEKRRTHHQVCTESLAFPVFSDQTKTKTPKHAYKANER